MLEERLYYQLEPPQDPQEFLRTWETGNDAQRDGLAGVAIAIKKENYAGIIIKSLEEKYQQAPDEERKHIVATFDRLGARNSRIEKTTTNLLISLLDADSKQAVAIVNGLQNKTQRAAIRILDPRETKRSSEDEIMIAKEILLITGKKYIDIISGNFSDEVKDRTWRGMWYCAALPELRPEIESALTKLADTTPSPELQKGARVELNNIIKKLGPR